MVGTIRRVWAGPTRATVIVTDAADGRDKGCFVWTTDTKGQLLASLCERAEANGGGEKRPVALTLRPRTRWGYEIEEAELMGDAQ